MKQQLQKDKGGTLQFRPVRLGEEIVPTAATVTIKRSDATTDLPGAAVVDLAATIASDGLLTYVLSAAQTAELGENWTADWTVTHDGTVTRHRDLWDVVRTILYPVLDERGLRRKMAGHAAFFFRKGTETYADTLGIAFDDLVREIEQLGRRPWLIIEASQLVDAHAARTLWYLCDSVAQNEGGVWWKRKEEWAEEFRRQLQNLPIRYDASDDGQVSATEDRGGFGTGRIVRA